MRDLQVQSLLDRLVLSLNRSDELSIVAIDYLLQFVATAMDKNALDGMGLVESNLQLHRLNTKHLMLDH